MVSQPVDSVRAGVYTLTISLARLCSGEPVLKGACVVSRVGSMHLGHHVGPSCSVSFGNRGDLSAPEVLTMVKRVSLFPWGLPGNGVRLGSWRVTRNRTPPPRDVQGIRSHSRLRE